MSNATAPDGINPLRDEGDLTIPLVTETVRIDKRQVVSGRVRVRTETETRDEVARESLLRESLEIVRVPIDRAVNEQPQIRTEGDVTIVPVVEERLVVERRLFLVEEVRIRRRTASEDVELPVTLRAQRAVIERLDANEVVIEDQEKNT